MIYIPIMCYLATFIGGVLIGVTFHNSLKDSLAIGLVNSAVSGTVFTVLLFIVVLIF